MVSMGHLCWSIVLPADSPHTPRRLLEHGIILGKAEEQHALALRADGNSSPDPGLAALSEASSFSRNCQVGKRETLALPGMQGTVSLSAPIPLAMRGSYRRA